MSAAILLGFLAFVVTAYLVTPVSREIVLKLGTLMDMARRANAELFRAKLEPINPFVGKAFKHHRIGRVLRADLSEFGEICLRLQRETRRLDVRAHVYMLPMIVYSVGLGLWLFWR